MRATVAAGLFVLVLVLIARGLVELERESAAGEDGGTWVFLVSRGPLLPASSALDPGDQVDAAIVAGDRTFGPEGAVEALLAQAFDERGRPARRARFGRLADVAELAAFADAVEPGGFLALAHVGGVVADAAREPFAALLFALGARRSPADGSWAYLGERTASGWRALGESASAECGVTLASHLPSARERPPLFETERLDGPGTVVLTRETPAVLRDASPYGGVAFAGGTFEAWGVLAGAEDGPALLWRPLVLGADSTLTLGVAVRRGGADVLVRATVAPLDGGEPASWDLAVGRDRAERWIPLVLDLGAFDGRRVSLGLEARTAGPDATAEAFFARPTLSFRSP